MMPAAQVEKGLQGIVASTMKIRGYTDSLHVILIVRYSRPFSFWALRIECI